MSNVIEIVDLKKRFGSGENEALIYDGANLNIEKGSFVSLTALPAAESQRCCTLSAVLTGTSPVLSG